MNREQVKKLRKGQKLIFFERGMSDINGAHVVFFQIMITEIKPMPRDAVPGTIILRVVKAEKYLYNEKMGMIVNANVLAPYSDELWERIERVRLELALLKKTIADQVLGLKEPKPEKKRGRTLELEKQEQEPAFTLVRNGRKAF